MLEYNLVEDYAKIYYNTICMIGLRINDLRKLFARYAYKSLMSIRIKGVGNQVSFQESNINKKLTRR